VKTHLPVMKVKRNKLFLQPKKNFVFALPAICLLMKTSLRFTTSKTIILSSAPYVNYQYLEILSLGSTSKVKIIGKDHTLSGATFVKKDLKNISITF
jgi:hypothetical protein